MIHEQISSPRNSGRWLLVVNVVLLALTAQLFREDFFGLTRPVTSVNGTEYFSYWQPHRDSCAGVTCDSPPDSRCAAGAGGGGGGGGGNSTSGNSSNSTSGNSTAGAGTCKNGACEYASVADGTSCDIGIANADFVCVGGYCISANDECAGVSCNTPADPQCQVAQGSCSNGQCSYRNVADFTFCTYPTGSNAKADIFLGAACFAGKCIPKTRSETTSFAYDAAISTGIVSAALAVEVIFTGSASPDLAAFAITTGLVAIGWTAFSRDQGAFPHDRALVRAQNAFVFLAAGLAFLYAFGFMHKKKGAPSTVMRILGVVNIVVSTVQFGLVARLFDQHFDKNKNGEIDEDANILFNWAYPASIYAAQVSIAVAFSLLVTGAASAGFGFFQLVTGVIALAWASNLQDEGTYSHSFTDSSNAWQSFAIIAGSYSIIVGLFLLVKGKSGESRAKEPAKLIHRVVAAVLVCVFFVVIGQVSSLFHEHFISRSPSVRGSNMLIVAADHDNNYGNVVAPFAWPISIWTAAVVVSFGMEVIVKGAAQTGIVALALTESANLVGWAAEFVYFGSPVNNSIEGLARGWGAVCLGGSLVAFLLALEILRNSDNEELSAEQFANHEDRPKQDA
jgi:hypothetical protein